MNTIPTRILPVAELVEAKFEKSLEKKYIGDALVSLHRLTW